MSVTAATTASPFAALLRRSKFASFDSQIAQVYTSGGGDARRGNWGVKRPLPLRRRGGNITLQKLDSTEQQTEWNSAEQQARWIKKWDELKVEPIISVGSQWSNQTGHYGQGKGLHDSEFTEGESADRSSATPNVEAMSEPQFKRYLKQIRTQRPQFLEFLKSELAPGENVDVSPLSQTRATGGVAAFSNATSLCRTFVGQQAKAHMIRPEGTTIQNYPHRNAGLNYSHTSELERVFTTKPQPGLYLHEPTQHASQWSRDRQREKDNLRVAPGGHLLASFAGMTSRVAGAMLGDAVSPLFDPNASKYVTSKGVESSVRPMVLMRAYLEQAPQVVGRVKQGLKGTTVMTVIAESDDTHTRLPWSKEHNFEREVDRSHAETMIHGRGAYSANNSYIRGAAHAMPRSSAVESSGLMSTLQAISDNSSR